MDPLTAVLLFFAYLAIDALYALYTMQLVERRAARAATLGSVMYVLIAFGTISYVQSYWYVIPIGLGSWLGTYGAVRFQDKIAQRFDHSPKESNPS